MSIEYLESADHVKSSLQQSMHYEPSTSKALEISSCVIQGQRFFETASTSPMVLKPLLTFYGMSALTKALILARTKQSLNTLKASHGLTDVTPSKALIGKMELRVNSSGTFCEFNDVVSALECVTYSTDTEAVDIFIPTAKSENISDLKTTIEEIWARCPTLGSEYQKTFKKEPQTIHLSMDVGYFDTNEKVIKIIPATGTHTIDDIKSLTSRLRDKYSFLQNLSLIKSESDGSSTTLCFANFSPDENEFTRMMKMSGYACFEYNQYHPKKYSDYHELKNIYGILPPLSGGIGLTEQRYINPIDGNNIAEWSLMYMGCYLLSSYCRYRPDDWMHVIQGRITPTRALDNKTMVYINVFLKRILENFPHYISNAINTTLPDTGNTVTRPHNNAWV